MNTVPTLVLSFLFGCLCLFAHGAENENLAARVEFYSAELKKIVDPERWEIQVDEIKIVIESKFKIGIQQRVSPAVGEKPSSKSYRIELSFKPKLSKDAYIKLALERVDYSAIVNYGAKTKLEWSNAHKFLTDNPLPRYDVSDRVGKPYSVYVFTTDSVSISIVPAEKYAEVKGVEALIDQIFWPSAN